MASRLVASWGNVFRAPHVVYDMRGRDDSIPTLPPGETLLPFGNGRSYGDSCLNQGGASLQMRALDHFIRLDRKSVV